ncbi:MAG: class I SAM-dependent methyltransferase [Deltaproteobacteria bacterium]|nr:class I SAM-dependent methyltransferase [Deltaproteobacteria bacterium]
MSNSYRLKNRFQHIWTYPSRRHLDAVLLRHLKRLNGAKVLDYGCGRGDLSLYILAQGGVVHGIDISPVYIQDATERCGAASYDMPRYRFDVMDCHAMDFPSDFFDIVVGLGILHHLESDMALHEIHRVLKPGGRLLLQEPLADNPLLRLFRKLTPSARTVDERPFTTNDLKRLKNSTDWYPQMYFCGVLEAPAAMITSVLMPSRPDNFILQAADWAERKLHLAGLFDAWNQYVLINLVKRATA